MRSNNNDSGKNGGIGFTGLLTLAFIVLKLCHVIEWSWIWVLSPIWITTLLVIVVAAIIVIYERWKE